MFLYFVCTSDEERHKKCKRDSILSQWVRLSPLCTVAAIGILYKPQMIDDGDCGAIWWNEDWQGKPKYSEKTYSSAILSTINPTWPDPGSNPGRRSGKLATNRLSYGAAQTRQ
jgi:hypothetical protein